MGKNRNAYIHQIGSHVIGVIDCSYTVINGVYDDDTHTFHRYDHNSPTFPQFFWRDYGYKVKEVIGKMGSSARGRILACGVAESGNGMVAYHEVNESLINAQLSGDELLTLLASYVITAAMVDIFRHRLRSIQDREERRAARMDNTLNHNVATH